MHRQNYSLSLSLLATHFYGSPLKHQISSSSSSYPKSQLLAIKNTKLAIPFPWLLHQLVRVSCYTLRRLVYSLFSMATTTSSSDAVTHNASNVMNKNNQEVSRTEIQAAIAKAVELRSIHAALMQGSSPSNLRFPSPSPASRPVHQFSAQDYPVFTPSYEDEPFASHRRSVPNSKTLSETWDEYGLDGGSPFESTLSDYNKDSVSSRKGFASGLHDLDPHMCPGPVAKDQISVTGSCANNVTVLRSSPGSDLFKSSRRNSLTDSKSVSSCNRCKPAKITSESASGARNGKYSNIVVPLTDSHSSAQSQQKSRGMISWLFPKLKKKHKNEQLPCLDGSEGVSQVLKDLGITSVATLKRELIEANETRDAALMEVAQMKSLTGDLKQKLEYLERNCEELKKALKLATLSKNLQATENLGSFRIRGKSAVIKGENSMPVTQEVMVEGFLQMVSEARQSVNHFCRTLVGQVDETDGTLIDNLNLLLQPYKLSLNSKYTKAVLCHLEATINQSLYQDFENPVFQKNGSPKLLDPHQDRQAQFSSFVGLRNLSWNEVLRKGTKFYSEEFSKFCDQKMSCIITTLNWTRPWPEHLLQAFFISAKCIWLLHLLAFSFNPVLSILRVDENRSYDPQYMEDMFMDRQRTLDPSRVKVMVMPGFYVQDKVLRCKVLCKYKSVA